MDYVDCLENDRVIRNFIQGKLWKKLKAQFRGQVVLPLFLHFDDYDPNSALGSHANSHSLGALYAFIPCLPPQLRSRIENMFLVIAMLTKDHKKCGNAIAFNPVIEELKYLQETGLSIYANSVRHRVYFCYSLLVADNKGNNTVQGYVESFSANFYCRICKMHRNDASRKCCADAALRRNADNYQTDVDRNDFTQTGVKDMCVWNKLPLYHNTQNISCDVMHDIYEGMLMCGLCAILRNLIVDREYFSLETFHERVAGFDYGPSDSGNKPCIARLTIDRF
ncbi:hypothetical protein ONE63_003451 [Megalurothrips usitatus]|uniref:Uncharacterized protein n=1 Tax=Megalurothrips usitatus TaxID=439358 RepID=A0AAV7X824_9NEOP|nr:hypothetical protein ONE63_003451 [Megalurothrips usitatus]